MRNFDPLIPHNAILMIGIFAHDAHFVAEDLIDKSIAAFTLLAVRGEQITEVSLRSLLAGKRGLVLTTYLLDFTGG